MYRFRIDEGKLVLQVVDRSNDSSPYYNRDTKWRDAKVEDIPVRDPFGREGFSEAPNENVF